ncbi:MAG: hypothetical protein HC812_15880 [Leptolyngbya sp. RL_3_1]|nr:hypothetical protein [Leptolyngbya sp. RL_3_1]
MNSTPEPTPAGDDLSPEYRFDYQKAKPNRFAVHSPDSAQATVILDADVAKIFTTSEAVNKALRALIAAIPEAAIRISDPK